MWLVLIAAAAIASAQAAAPSWSARPPLPQPLAGHAAAAAGGTLWVAGGSVWSAGTKRIESAIYLRRAGERQWRHAGAIPDGYAHGGAAADDEALWLAGGFGDSGPRSAVNRIDLAAGRVTEIARLPEPRVYCGAALARGSLWVIGGTAADGDFARTSGTCWRVDVASGEVHVESTAGPRWINPLVLAFDAELHVLPGSEWSDARRKLEPPRDVWIYRLDERRWHRRALATTLPRGLSGVRFDARHALVAGGVDRNGALSRDAWCYDAGTGKLTPAPDLPAPRLAAAAVVTGKSILFLGGEDRPRSRAGTIWQLPIDALSDAR